MKKKLTPIAILCCSFYLTSNAQNNLPSETNYLTANKELNYSNNSSRNDLEYQNAVLGMEVNELKEAYNYLERKVERMKSVLEQYQKVIQQNTITPSAESFTCSTGDAFLEQVAPNTFTENSAITYFIPAGFKKALLTIIDKSGIPVLKYDIKDSCYGQVTEKAGELNYGSYNYCLYVDGKKVDGKKMILTK